MYVEYVYIQLLLFVRDSIHSKLDLDKQLTSDAPRGKSREDLVLWVLVVRNYPLVRIIHIKKSSSCVRCDWSKLKHHYAWPHRYLIWYQEKHVLVNLVNYFLRKLCCISSYSMYLVQLKQRKIKNWDNFIIKELKVTICS